MRKILRFSLDSGATPPPFARLKTVRSGILLSSQNNRETWLILHAGSVVAFWKQGLTFGAEPERRGDESDFLIRPKKSENCQGHKFIFYFKDLIISITPVPAGKRAQTEIKKSRFSERGS